MEHDTSQNHLTGKLLIAMPGIKDPHFQRSVIYLCAHSPEGAMGLIINQRVRDLDLPTFLARMKIKNACIRTDHPVYIGGPIDPERGFVLHSPEYSAGDATLVVNKGFAMTSTLNVIEDVARGEGPERSLVALGYAGWGAGQLDREMLSNGWLTVTAGPNLVFSLKDEEKWAKSLRLLGIAPQLLSATAGHA